MVLMMTAREPQPATQTLCQSLVMVEMAATLLKRNSASLRNLKDPLILQEVLAEYLAPVEPIGSFGTRVLQFVFSCSKKLHTTVLL